MSDEGERVRARRERLGMGKRELADLAGVSRDTLAAIEEGQGFRRSSLTKIEQALANIEEEAGFDAPPLAPQDSGPRLATFDVSGEGGFHIIVSGPIEDADVLKRQVVDIIQAMRKAEQDDPPSSAG
jgi:transcriptional regulator with XRE-family HTH domain